MHEADANLLRASALSSAEMTTREKQPLNLEIPFGALRL